MTSQMSTTTLQEKSITTIDANSDIEGNGYGFDKETILRCLTFVNLKMHLSLFQVRTISLQDWQVVILHVHMDYLQSRGWVQVSVVCQMIT